MGDLRFRQEVLKDVGAVVADRQHLFPSPFLLVNLAGTAWLSIRFLRGRVAFHRLERWQTAYLPIFALWVAAVVVVLPPLFAFA